jgi:hypothetical protein
LVVSEATFHRWRAQYGGVKAEEAVRLKKLEDENRRLKQLVADQVLDIQMLKVVAEGNWGAALGIERPSSSAWTSLRRPSVGPAKSWVNRDRVSVAAPSRAAMRQ